MRRNVFLFVGLAMLSFASCSKYAEVTSMDSTAEASNQEAILKIPMSKEKLTEDDARIVAVNVLGRADTKSGSMREVSDVFAIYGEDGVPAIYVVNFKDNKGFSLISATKKYFPVLAESETGHFSLDFEDSGLGIVMNDYLESISYYKTLPADSLVNIRRLWRGYEYQEIDSNSQTKSGIDPEDWSYVRTYWESRWQSEGKTWYQLQNKPYDMPQEMYENFLDVAEMECNEDYPYLYYCYITEESTYTPQTVYGPLVTTSWNQDDEYKDSSLGNTSLGCETVAAGQLMKYHRYPNSWNWDGMPDNYGTSTTRSFLKDVHNGVTIFAGSNEVLTKLYLESQDYHTELSSHNMNSVRTSIIGGYPVISSGLIPGRLIGHAWVTCGYKKPAYLNNRFELYVVGLDTYPLPELEMIYSEDDGASSGCGYFYQNWGAQASYNGWFMEEQYPLAFDHDYSSCRKDLICYPRNN